MNSESLPIWKLESNHAKTFLDLAAKLAENGDVFLLIGKQVSGNSGSWLAINGDPGETEQQRKSRMIAFASLWKKQNPPTTSRHFVARRQGVGRVRAQH